MFFRVDGARNRAGNRVFRIAAGDIRPKLSGQLLDDDGDPQSLVGVSAIVFRYGKVGSDTTSTRSATILDATTGTLEVDWQSGDLDDAGVYRGFFELDRGSGAEETAPPRGVLFDVTTDP